MNTVETDNVRRLDASLASFRAESLAACGALSDRITEMNASFDRLVLALSDEDGDDSLAERVRRMPVSLAQSALAKGDVASLCREATKSPTQILQILAELRDGKEWVDAANQELTKRLLKLKTENGANAVAIAKADEELTALREALSQHSDNLTAITAELEQARRERDEARKAVKKRDVSSARQQRIVLEMLNSDGTTRKIGEILLSADVITRRQLDKALDEQHTQPDRFVGSILVENGYTGEDEVAQTLACQFDMPLINPTESTLNADAARLADAGTCMAHSCIPLRTAEDRIYVAMANPRDTEAIEAIEQACSRHVVPLVATPSDIAAAIDSVFGGAK